MVEPVSQNVRQKAASATDLLEVINREVVPVVRETRERFNELVYSYQPRWVPTDVLVADYTASPGELVKVDPSGGGFIVELPEAITCEGEEILVKNVTTSATAITISSAALVEGGLSMSASGSLFFFRFLSDGVTWWRSG